MNEIFRSEGPFANQDATYLHVSCDLTSDLESSTEAMIWGYASMQWQYSVGSVIVVRQDKKPLLPLHVEALCKYCRYDIRPFFAHSLGEYDEENPMSEEAVLAVISRSTFVIYWYKLLDEKHQEGADVSIVDCP